MEKLARRTLASTRNVLELARFGRLGTPYAAPFEIVDQGPHYRLRRYETAGVAPDAPIAVLVPPLMVTAEVYDLEEANSAIATLGSLGVQAYVVDFGAPEDERGGMKRTLDDHVLATASAVAYVRRTTGRSVHLLGYSQGGMFAYQCAAYLRSEGIASIVTFGSPVDIHKNLPAVHKDATAALIRAIEPLVTKSIESIEGLPGILTSTGFKLLSTRKEIAQRLDFLRLLHDRKALVRREARRKFLGGEGFVAWPGPAFREFVDQFIVHNRMLSGGFVLAGRTVTLADIHCPILAFMGSHDEMARPASIRAITKAAPSAEVSFSTIEAGHFGIVVGSRATRETWPTVAGWMHHIEGHGPKPEALKGANEPEAPAAPVGADEPEGANFNVDVELGFLADAVGDAAKEVFGRVGHLASSASDAYDAFRYQEPRLRRLAQMTSDTRVSVGFALAERAQTSPNETFFLWSSRAFTYRDADARVTSIVRGLWSVGVRPGHRVALLMSSRPSYLSVVAALSRLGAVAVLPPPNAAVEALREALSGQKTTWLATDPEHIAKARQLSSAVSGRSILVFGGGSRPPASTRPSIIPPGTGGALGAIDMEGVDPEAVEMPSSFVADAGRARDLAAILLRPSSGGKLRAAKVTNHRWALSAIGAAAACTIKPEDTVYCCIPLHHPTALLVSVGSALVGGARLALARSFETERFLEEVRRYGATIAFYAGEMLRPLVHHKGGMKGVLPLRLVAGSGMRADLGPKLKARYGFGIMEFYASTTQMVILANAAGKKTGALGRPLPGSRQVEVVALDRSSMELIVENGRLVRAEIDEPGLLVARLEDDEEANDAAGALRSDAFDLGDHWYISNDVVRKDADGDLWFVDSRSGFVQTGGTAISTRKVEDALFALPEVTMAIAWGEGAIVRAAISSEGDIEPGRIEEALKALRDWEQPVSVDWVPRLELTEGFRPIKPR